MLERIDIENLDDLTETLRELKLEPHHAPLVYTLEVLIKRLKSGGSPTGMAQLAAQITNIMKELQATPASENHNAPTTTGVLDKYRT